MKKYALILVGLLAAPVFGDITSIVGYPAGNNGDVQFNQNKRFTADVGNLTYSTTTKALTVQGIRTSTVTINGITYYFPTSECSGGTFFRYDGSGIVTCSNPGSFSISTGVAMGVWDGSVNITTATSDISFNSSQFIVTLQGTTTAYVSVDPSTVTVMGQLSATSPVVLTGSVFSLNSSSVTMRGPDPTLGGDLSGTVSNAVVTDDSHNHTTVSISGLDISADTNLSAESPVLLVGDQVRIDKSSATLLGPTIDSIELPSDGYASTYVNVTGDTMTGALNLTTATATGYISVKDETYDATSWNSSTQVPTKNAVRDKIEALSLAAQPAIVVGTGTTSGITGVPTSSPTAVMVYNSSQFSSQFLGGSTVYLELNSSSITLQGQNVIRSQSGLQSGSQFNVSSGTVAGPIYVGTATVVGDLFVGDDATIIGGLTVDGGSGITVASLSANECVETDSSGRLVSAGAACGTGSGGSATLPLPGGATNYIQNRETLQAGASFYVQKGYAQDGIVASGVTSYIAYPSSSTGGSTGFWCNDVESTGGESSTCFYAAALYSDNPWAFYAGAGKSRFLETHIERGNELRFYAPAETYQRYVAFKSSAGFTATDSNQTYVLPRSTGTVGQVLAIQSVDTEAHLYWKTDDNGSGSSFGIVSPGTFTWTNPNGISVSTFSASATGTSISVFTSSATGTGANGGYFKCTGISCTGFIAQAEGSVGGGQNIYGFQAVANGGSVGQINNAGYFSATGSNNTNRAIVVANGGLYTNSSDGLPSQFLMSRGVNNTPSWTYPVISLSTQTTGSLPAASVAAGSLGASVIASSIAVGSVGIPQISATGTPDGTTFLRGDGAWESSDGGISAVYIGNDGVTVGTTTRVEFLPDTAGFDWVTAQVGTTITVQGVIDTAKVLTQATLQTGEPLFCDTDSNSGTTYTCSMVPTLAGYTTGQVFNVAIDSTSTGAATLNIDALGADSLLKSDGSAIESGDLVVGTLVQVWHDGTDFRLVDPVEGGSGVVTWGSITGTLSDQTDLQSVLSDIGTSTQSLKTTPHFKSVTVETPSSSEDVTLFFTDDAITITQLNAVTIGSSPSVTWTVRHDSDRSATGNEVVTSGTTTTSTTTGSEVTSFNDATIPAGSWVWLETTAQSGTVNSLSVSIEFTRD